MRWDVFGLSVPLSLRPPSGPGFDRGLFLVSLKCRVDIRLPPLLAGFDHPKCEIGPFGAIGLQSFGGPWNAPAPPNAPAARSSGRSTIHQGALPDARRPTAGARPRSMIRVAGSRRARPRMEIKPRSTTRAGEALGEWTSGRFAARLRTQNKCG